MPGALKSFIVFSVLVVFQLLPFVSYAVSPLGNWKAIDDKTGRVRGIVTITEHAGITEHTVVLYGTVTKLFPGSLKICTACKGRLHNKPILGMIILRGLKPGYGNPNEWSGGTFLDLRTGESWACNIIVSDDGRILRVYIGVYGRSQTWIRV